MGSTLAGQTVLLFGANIDLAEKPVVMVGIDSTGKAQPMAVAAGGAASFSFANASSGVPTDRSGTIVAGATAQDAAAALATRKYLLFENHSDTDMWINWGVTAVADQPSIKIPAGGSYENPPHFCPVGRISVICATTGKKFTCKEA